VLGQAIVVVAVAVDAATDGTGRLRAACRDALPTYMVPAHVAWHEGLPRNANGKIDRPAVAASFAKLFAETEK
jgi:acyl-coenzyme A synthetase/AMP-(fatty) acid ligase